MTTIPIWQVDAFTERPFAGNPAAVCLLDRFPPDPWMQQVAAEMNLAETAFVVPEDAPGRFQLRWFTPTVEVDLCGHATLAAAHTLREQNRVGADQTIRFQTRSGELRCRADGDRLSLDFPATPADAALEDEVLGRLTELLGRQPEEAARSRFDILVVLSSADAVRRWEPPLERLAALETRGLILTAAADADDCDFVSRFFAPRCGIPEDPVTGSAHCCLAPYWAARLGRDRLVGYQASRRGGTVHCEVAGDRVQLSGAAVTVMEARLLCGPAWPQ